MISATTHASPGPQAVDIPAGCGAPGRVPLLFLLGSGVLWLVLAAVLALISSIQLHSPEFLADCALLTYGRAQALAETAFVYGWIGNAGLALTLWILCRLSGEPLRASNWAGTGAFFWNAGIAIGMAGIATGGATALPMLELPPYVQPLLFAAYASVALAGVAAWTGRRREFMFASHWYAVAALFFFPWLFSVAQVMLLWFPVHGVLQAIVAGWYAQGLWTLWIAPLSLAGAYYVVPRVAGRVLPAYDSAVFGFWCLLLVGGWTGGRHLIGGPVPAWISSVAIGAAYILLFHYIVVALNLRAGFAGGGISLRFISFGVAAYALGGLLDAVTAVRGVAVITQFTHFDEAQRQFALQGGATMMLFGTLYFALPRIVGRPWASRGLVRGHLALSALGILLLAACLGAAGWVQGWALNDPKTAFSDIAGLTRDWLLGATGARALLLFADILLAVNFFRTLVCAPEGGEGEGAP
jgi:cytochrome c oxidase cbb3-type subunit 1